jgi:PDZ domain-containing secreted protein
MTKTGSTQNPFVGDPGYKYNPMDPAPGQKYVEFSKNGADGDVKVKGDPSGLDVEIKDKYIFLSKVDDPAPSHHLHAGDRIIALNGKKIEKYDKDLTAIRDILENYNVIRLVIDPTMQR